MNLKVQILHSNPVCVCVLALKTTKNGTLPKASIAKLMTYSFCLYCVSEVLIQIYSEFEAVLHGVEVLLFICQNCC